MSNMMLNAFVLLVLAAPACLAARDLKQRITGNGGTAFNNAMIITPSSGSNPASRTAASSSTNGGAETSANSAFNGAHRLVNPSNQRTYAVVESSGTGDADSSMKQNRAVSARSRSAQSTATGIGRTNFATGGSSMPALVTGQMVKAQTYQGATAVATTDSVALNRGSDAGAAIATDRLTARTGTLRRAGTDGSFGVAGEPVLSKAMAGAANGKIVLARADQAVSMVQAERP